MALKFKNKFIEVYYSIPNERWYALTIESVGEESKANICARAFGWSIYFWLPPTLLKPHKVQHAIWNETTNSEHKIFYEIFPNEYGFSLYEDGLSIRYGAQTHDSNTTKSKYFRIPWLAWRFRAHRIFDLDQNLIHELIEKPSRKLTKQQSADLNIARDTAPRVKFLFADFDGEIITAECYIEEREWQFGETWCWWLQYFKKPIICRNMNIEYDKEVGPKKGSWKGGMIGTSCNIFEDQSPTDAFIFHCLQNNLTFIQKL